MTGDSVEDLPRFDITGDLPTGTTLLEASAGTGKTWTIAALVTRYVAEGAARLEEMLVVTFGRAASQELRERVREQLVLAERVLADPASAVSDDVLTALLLQVDDAERAARRRRVRDALAAFDSATIATTHQFCQLVLKSLGVAGDTDAGAHLVEDLDDLLVEVVDDLYVRGFAQDPEAPIFSRSQAMQVARAAVGDPQARIEPRNAPADSVAGRRRRFAEAVRAEVDVRKRRLGVLSYDDLLSQLAEALTEADAPARERMRRRWSVVLVDEFQDTDPVQWQVLDRAFSGHATMVLIGDPKQAIYAFRGGDVVTYLAAADTATTRATLGTNHRSDAPLLAAVQTVLQGAALGDPAIVVRGVEASEQRSRLQGGPRPEPFRLRVVDRDQFGVKGLQGVTIGQLREHVATDLAMDVRALLGSGATFDGVPLEPRQVAVLCETRRQCEVAWRGLTAHGIPAVISGGGSVFATEGAAEWLTLLEAIEQPHRSARVRAAAVSVFFGRTAAEIDEGGDALTNRYADVLRDWADLYRERGIAAVFEAVTTTYDLTGRVLGRTDGERLMTDLRHTAEALHDTASRERLGLVALAGWMRAQMAQEKLEVSSERTRRLDSDAAAVQILTIHGSKGLQFPVVYLPGVCDHFPISPSMPLFHADDGHRCIDVGGAQADPAHVRRAMVEDSGEDLRLLYVAMTRAQSQLVTWWLPSAKNTTQAPLHRMLFGRAPGLAEVPADVPLGTDDHVREIARRWQDAGGPVAEPAHWSPSATPVRQDTAAQLGVREWTRKVDLTWRRTSYSALSSAAGRAHHGETGVMALGSEPEDPPRDDEPELPLAGVTAASGPTDAGTPAIPSPMARLPVGATFGSLVHAVLEHADPAAVAHGGDLREELAAHVREQLVAWPVTVDPDELAEALVAVCESPLGPLAGGTTLRAIGRADRMCELDFELPLAGGDLAPTGGRNASLRDLAPLLRRHLPEGDPLLPYADTVDDEAHGAQELRGYLTGSVDVLLRVGGRFLVVDYKTNWLGDQGGPGDSGAGLTSDHYRPALLAEAMTHSSYPLQALLYAVVLHRFLRWRLPDYDPERHFGGVLYLYLRGMCGPETPQYDGHPCGVFSWRPPMALVEEISDLLDGPIEAVA